jgi:hypothetical protein
MNCDSEDKSALTERYIALVPELISAVWPGPSPNSKHRLRHCVITLFRCLVELVRLVKDVRVTTHALQDRIEIISPDADEPILVFSWKPVSEGGSRVQLLLDDAVSFDFSKPERTQILQIYNHLLSVVEQWRNKRHIVF